MSVTVMVVLVVFIQAFLHYAPWRIFLGRKLPRLAAYTLGVLGLMVPFTVWLIEQGEKETVVALWLVILAGGSSVALLYGVDWIVGLVWDKHEANEREKAALTAIKEVVNGQGK